MRLLILAAALLLTGCWVGDGLYSSSDARQPIPTGIYRTTSGEERVQIEKVTLLPSGLTEIGDGDGKGFYGFAPLDKENRRFVAWYRKDEETAQDRGQVYMLLERRSADEFVLYMPECKASSPKSRGKPVRPSKRERPTPANSRHAQAWRPRCGRFGSRVTQ